MKVILNDYPQNVTSKRHKTLQNLDIVFVTIRTASYSRNHSTYKKNKTLEFKRKSFGTQEQS
jgi:hypothetical protein